MKMLVESKISLESVKGSESNLQEGIASKAKLLESKESKGPLQGVQEYLPLLVLTQDSYELALDFYRDFQENLMDSLMDPPDLLRGISLTDRLDSLRGIIAGIQDLFMDFSKDSANFPQERTGRMQEFLMSLQEPSERTGPMEVFLKSPQEFITSTQDLVKDMAERLELVAGALSLTEGQHR